MKIDGGRLTCGLALAVLLGGAQPSPAATTPGHVVSAIARDSAPVSVAPNVDVIAPDGVRHHGIRVGDWIPDGATVVAPRGIAVTVRSSDHWTTETVHPASAVRFDHSGRGHLVTVSSGAVTSAIDPQNNLDFYGVQHTTFVAAARSTEFTVSVGPSRISFTCAHGIVDIFRTRTVYIESDHRRIEGVRESTVIRAHEQVSYALSLDQYLNRFHTLGGPDGARAYYTRIRDQACASSDRLRCDAALDALARLLAQEGQYRDAQPVAQQQLALAHSLPGGSDSPTLANALYRSATIDDGLGQPARALSEVERSTVMWGRVDPANTDPAHGWAEIEYGSLLKALGRYEDARAALDRSLTIFAQAEPVPGSGTMIALEARASIEADYGEYDKSLPLIQRAGTIAERLAKAGGDTPETAAVYDALADAYSAINNDASSERYAQRALAAWKLILGGENHVEVAADYFRINHSVALAEHAYELSQQTESRDVNRAAFNLYLKFAEAFLNQERYDEARLAYARASPVAQRLAASGSPGEIEELEGALGDLAVQEGNVTEALAHDRRRLELAQQVPGNSPWLLGRAYQFLAYAFRSALDFDDARDASLAASAFFVKSAGADSSVALKAQAWAAVAELRAHRPGAAASVERVAAAAEAPGFSLFKGSEVIRALAEAAEMQDDFSLGLALRARALRLDRQASSLDPLAVARDETASAVDIWSRDARAGFVHISAASRAYAKSAAPAFVYDYFADVLPTGSAQNGGALPASIAPVDAIRRRWHPAGNDHGTYIEDHIPAPLGGPVTDATLLRRYESALRYDQYVTATLQKQSSAPSLEIARRLRYLTIDSIALGHRADVDTSAKAAADELDRVRAVDPAPAVASEYAVLIDLAAYDASEATLELLLPRARTVAAGGRDTDAAELLVSIANAEVDRDPASAVADLAAARAVADPLPPDERREIIADGFDRLGEAQRTTSRWSGARDAYLASCQERELAFASSVNGVRLGRALAVGYDRLAEAQILTRDSGAAASAKRGLALAPDRLENQLRVAEALLFAGDVDGANSAYATFRAKRADGREFADRALAQLAKYRAAGVTMPYVATVEAQLRK